MKKMLTTLTAIALSIVMVSTVEAKRGQRVQRTVTATTPGTMSTEPKDIQQAAKALRDAKTEEGKQEAAENLVAMIDDPNKTPEQQELDAKNNRKKELMDLIAGQEKEKKDINYGFFGFGTTKEQQEKYNELVNSITTHKAELKAVEARIKELDDSKKKAYSNAMQSALTALKNVGIIGAVVATAYGVDRLVFKGRGMEALGTAYRTYAPERLGGTAVAPAVQENVYGRTKRWLAEKAGTTAEKFPAGQTYDVPRVRTPRAPMSMERAADLSDM